MSNLFIAGCLLHGDFASSSIGTSIESTIHHTILLQGNLFISGDHISLSPLFQRLQSTILNINTDSSILVYYFSFPCNTSGT